MAIKRFQCVYTLLHRRAWQRRGAAEHGRGEEWSLVEAKSGAWQRQGAEPEAKSGYKQMTGALKSWVACALKVVYITPFLWLAVLAASGCVVTMVGQRETGRATMTGGGGSVEESG